MPVTRFAPSPNGPLHLGQAFSAITAQDLAGEDGRFLLRIEDIDPQRSKPEWERRIHDDLHWLGLDWPEPVLRQSRAERERLFGRLRRAADEPGWRALADRLLVPFHARLVAPTSEGGFGVADAAPTTARRAGRSRPC